MDAFLRAQDLLKRSNWMSLGHGSLEFDSIEIDCLLHLYDASPSSSLAPPSPLFIVPPPKALKKKPSVYVPNISPVKISSAAINEANYYATFEITTDSGMLLDKVAQLERDLTVLLCRQRIIRDSPDLKIEHIVRYAGIVAPKANRNEFLGYLQEYANEIPLLYNLWCCERVVMAKIGRDEQYVAGKLSRFNSLSDVLSLVKANSRSMPNIHDIHERVEGGSDVLGFKSTRMNDSTHTSPMGGVPCEANRKVKAEVELVEKNVLKVQAEIEKMQEEKKKIMEERLYSKYEFLTRNGLHKEAQELMDIILDLD